MNWHETPLLLECEGESLVGVLCAPAPPTAMQSAGVVIVVGGPQYRAGSHRQFTDLARRLAAVGFATLRLDLRGMGDSTGSAVGFEDCSADIAAAIDALLRLRPGLCEVVLWGLCDGASAALLYIDERADSRVAALCLLNPWVRSPVGLARTRVRHYYLERLTQRSFWTKLLRGGVAFHALRELAANVKLARAAGGGADTSGHARFQDRMARAWQRFDGALLLILSGNDHTAKEFIDHVRSSAAWHGALARPRVQRCDMSTADHTFSEPADAQAVEERTIEWMRSALTRGAP
jgi:uncharacterized protein